MLTISKLSYDSMIWGLPSSRAYFVKDGRALTVGEVIDLVGKDGGSVKWKATKLSDAVRLVEARAMDRFDDGAMKHDIEIAFRVNVETAGILIDNIDIKRARSANVQGLEFASFSALNGYLQ